MATLRSTSATSHLTITQNRVLHKVSKSHREVTAMTFVKGRVSRASPVHTGMRNCSRDEGGPFGFGDQEPIPSHRKLLRSKAVVVSVAETSGQGSRQAGSREASASEPLQKRRKRIRRCRNRGVTLPAGRARAMP